MSYEIDEIFKFKPNDDVTQIKMLETISNKQALNWL